MRRSFRIFLCIGASGGASLVSAAAHADFVPGDLLVTMELSVVAGEGRIYRVNDGGDFSEATPDFAMPAGPDDGSPAHIIDICSTDDGRVLVATSVTQTVYDVTSGVREVFATIPDDASGLYCGHGKVYVTSFLVEPKMFDITAGGEVTEPFAVGVNRSPVIDRGGRIWASRFDLEGGQDRGVFRDIHPGDDLSHATSWFQGFDVFSAVLADDRVMAVFFCQRRHCRCHRRRNADVRARDRARGPRGHVEQWLVMGVDDRREGLRRDRKRRLHEPHALRADPGALPLARGGAALRGRTHRWT